ncbi:hypothetical protein CNMCM8980_003670 [Aspergillus fumigatiaffinis]|nr:hypothetical protein CNMCM5878_001987 [Aspergillus fumigatiaffinis]KAF4221874.1 hypothetical protein CNMCM6457_001570 [Aspergillus fumigatiaffinis]KAF4234862.1 hypothetical protein CNMCM8980_003670 [Aspergillus fumigatiaffinis]
MWHSRIFSFGTLFLALSLVILSPVWATSNAFSTFTSKASDLRTRIDDARAAVDGFNGGMMEAMSVAKSLYSLESARRETFDQANQCDVFTGDEMLELMNHMEGFHDSVLKALQSVASKTELFPVGIVPFLAHHRVPKRTVINIQAILEPLAHRPIRRDILVKVASAHSMHAPKELALGAATHALVINPAGASDRDVRDYGRRWSGGGGGFRGGFGDGGGASDGAVPVLVVGAVRVLHAVRVARVQEVRVLLERGAGAEEACAAAAAASAAASASASQLGRAGAEGQGRRLGRERDGAGL